MQISIKQIKFITLFFIIVCILLIASVIYFIFLGEPREAVKPQTIPLVQFDENAQKTLVDRFTNRRPLSTDDQATKTKLLTLVPSDLQSERVYQGVDFAVDYVRSADLFQVEIQTINVDIAKDEANTWFLEHGMSQQGICD